MFATGVCVPATGPDAAGVAVTSLFDPYRAVASGLGVRYLRFHPMQSRADLYPAEPKIEAFLTHLAVEGRVAPATLNQAMNPLLFLYKNPRHSG